MDEWRSVSDGLPENGALCLIRDEFGEIYISVFHNGWFGTFYNRIVAWMPLPEPYKDVENE